MTTDPSVQDQLSKYGQDIGVMLKELGVPKELVRSVADAVLTFSAKELDDMYEMLRARCISQKTQEILIQDGESGYEDGLVKFKEDTLSTITNLLNK